MSDREAIGGNIETHFHKLFAHSNNHFPSGLRGIIPEVIEATDNDMFCKMPDDNEIWLVVKSIGAAKAPGPD